MSRKSEAKRSVHAADARLSGARATRAQRKANAKGFIDWCFVNGHLFNSIADASAEMVRQYLVVAQTTNGGCTVATLHNKLAAIRKTMSALGANPTERGVTAKNLDLPSRPRKGTKEPVTDEVFENAVARATELGELGFVIALKLERFLGLRGLEALMSVSALKEYAVEASRLVAGEIQPISIFSGTKGGRSRDTVVILDHARETLATIRDALAFAAGNRGVLLRGKTLGLKSARALYHRLAQKVGLTGVYSPHSLRYRFCCDKIIEMHRAGLSRTEALARAAAYLGHGPSRGRFVSLVYGRSVVHLLPVTRQKNGLIQNAREVQDLMDRLLPMAVQSSDCPLPPPSRI